MISPLRRVIVYASLARRRDQLRRRHVELVRALLEGVAFVGRLDLAHQNQPVGSAVDGPRRRRRRLGRGVGRRTFCHAASIGQSAETVPLITGNHQAQRRADVSAQALGCREYAAQRRPTPLAPITQTERNRFTLTITKHASFSRVNFSCLRVNFVR